MSDKEYNEVREIWDNAKSREDGLEQVISYYTLRYKLACNQRDNLLAACKAVILDELISGKSYEILHATIAEVEGDK